MGSRFVLAVSTCIILALLFGNPQFRSWLLEDHDAVRDVPVHDLHDEYDFIVVGSGPGGATIASRLSENPNWTVLLLEAGGHENIITDIPIIAEFLKQSSYNWGYLSQPQPATACLGMKDGRCRLSGGKALGGTTVINHVIYTRGHAKDYDEWEQLGNPGWGWKSVLPYFLKSENAQGELADSQFHSTGGLLDIETSYIFPIAQAFFKAGLEFGFPVTDLNSGLSQGFSLPQSTTRNGARCSASKAFLRPAAKRYHLHVSVYSHVTKVLIDPETKTTLGVNFYKEGQNFTVRARKEVILSAGAIKTPQLLLLSGIGSREHLDSLGINVIQDLPGVGQNLQEHVQSPIATFVVNDTVTTVLHRMILDIPSMIEYMTSGQGKLTSTNLNGVGYMRTSLATGSPGIPDIELVFVPGSFASDAGLGMYRYTGIRDDIYQTVYAPLHGKDTWSIWTVLLRPRSKGWIKLKNSNPLDNPLINVNYYSDEHDVLSMVEAIKLIVELGKSKEFQRYNSTLHDIPIPDCKEFQFASDEYWTCTIRVVTIPGNHFCCTAMMGPKNDSMAVIDPELKVYGVSGLRIVDASVMPNIITAHNMAVVYMIAEKVADNIKNEHS